MQSIKINPDFRTLRTIRTISPRLVSYNIEMAEVTGGTFWKAYTPEQIAGTQPVTSIRSVEDQAGCMQVYPPIELADRKLRCLAAALGPAWVRVSGTWATKTYYDFDGHTGGTPPEGYQNVLTADRWRAVLDFVKAVEGRLLISVSHCAGTHDEPWRPDQARLIFDASRDYGVPIDAVEFINEPNFLAMSGLPKGYTAADYARDQDIFCRFVRENYPGTQIVGPCTATVGSPNVHGLESGLAGKFLPVPIVDELMAGAEEMPDVFSYHCYFGTSQRIAAMGGCWEPEEALSEAYLSVAADCAGRYGEIRDRLCPGAPLWVTESGDAAGGGTVWASTYLDVLRTLNELGSFARLTDGVIFHNTLAASDYGFLAPGTFEPRPNYFAVLLWNRLMGTAVYDAEESCREGAHVYVHGRKDGKPGAAWLVLNNSRTEETAVALPVEAERYTLSAPRLRAGVMTLNGRPLVLDNGRLPDMEPMRQAPGTVLLPPATATFLLV